MDTIVICSGGLDSVSLAHKVAGEGRLLSLLSFDYGQRHVKEVAYAAACAKRLGVAHKVLDIRAIGAGLSGSALTDDIDVPDGHYEEASMKLTVVPNRNAIMLSIAFGLAAAVKAKRVAAAVHGGDHFIYPDCRPGFMQAFQVMQNHALEGYADVTLYTPYVQGSKADIITDGASNGTPFEQTWSCYKGGDRHCGRCGTCVERREAFDLAGVTDPTDYADNECWKTTLASGRNG